MPIVRRRRVSKRKPMRKVIRRAPMVRRRRVRSGNVPEYASLSVTRTLAGNLPPDNNFGLGQLYSLMNTSLEQFPRAVQVAQAYQHYKIKRISVRFKPSYDSFVAGVGNSTKPRLYYMIDKAGAIPTNIALEGLKQMGARPKELDEKPFTVSWAPSVLESGLDNPNNVASKYIISPWLATNNQPIQPGVFVPSSIDHLGLYWFLDSINNPEGYQYECEVEVQFQFKKPISNVLASGSAYKVSHKVIDNSADGVVGGHDGVIQAPL